MCQVRVDLLLLRISKEDSCPCLLHHTSDNINQRNRLLKTPVVGGLLACGWSSGTTRCTQEYKSRIARGAGKRGRPQAKKRVSWASESSLVSNTTNNMSVMVVEEKAVGEIATGRATW